MNPYYTILLLAFLILLAILLIRYVNNTVDHEFRSLSQASNDPEFRSAEIRRLNGLLLGALPLPAEAPTLPAPRGGARGALPPVLLALGVILLWGAGSAPKDREWWFYGGLASVLLAGLIVLATLRRRKWARTARLLLFRANLKRMDNDRIGAAEDLRELLRLTPWDDSAWAELSDDMAAQRKLPEALAAMGEAAKLDPRYDEYRMVQASLAIRMGELGTAEEIVAAWKDMDGVDDDDPRLKIYQAAMQLARGERERAAATLKPLLLDHDDHGMEFLDSDQALAGIRDLLPGRTP